MSPKSYNNHDSSYDECGEVYKEVLRALRNASKTFVGGITPPDMEKMKEATHRTLKQLSDKVPEIRRMIPAYEIICDPVTGRVSCNFHMDVPYVEARAVLHRPENIDDEQWEAIVREIMAELQD